MTILPKPTSLLATLQTFEPFKDVPEEALLWLINQSNYCLYKKGENLFIPKERIDHMTIIVEGEYLIKIPRRDGMREVGTWGTGYVTGVLPFSRMESASAYGVALRDTYTLRLHREKFTEMVNVSYKLTQNLVAIMSNRIRDFSAINYQNEKLMSLGKLSAGLAHELNNPASAMVRGAEELHQRTKNTPEKFKAVITMRVTEEQTDAVNEILFERIANGADNNLSTLDRTELEDDLLDWLEDHEVEHADEIVESLVDYHFALDHLEGFKRIMEGENLSPLLNWVANALSVESTVCEIKESADRIAGLIKSIKSYSHMDEGISTEYLDIHEGLISTLTMLKHPLRDKQIRVEKDFGTALPKIKGMSGQLNQIWTNLIDNAIDAMDKGGTLHIRTYQQRNSLCVHIEDSGSGIPVEDLERIFDPFFTTKGIGEGTGIGLDMVRKIVLQHKGDIKVSSEPGATIFRVCFPI